LEGVESSGMRDTFLGAPALSHKKSNNKEKKRKKNRKPK